MVNRMILILVILTVILQAAVLHKQYNGGPPAAGEVTSDAPSGVVLQITGMPARGSDDARVVLVEFSDYECPFCIRHAGSVGKEIEKEFVATGKIRHIFANRPLSSHKNATMLATGAVCAGAQGNYWEMHDKIFESKAKTKDQIIGLANDLSLEMHLFQGCLEKASSPGEIDRDVAKADELGLTGTPGFALGRVDPTGREVRIQKLIRGAVPLAIFKKEFESLLSQKT